MNRKEPNFPYQITLPFPSRSKGTSSPGSEGAISKLFSPCNLEIKTSEKLGRAVRVGNRDYVYI